MELCEIRCKMWAGGGVGVWRRERREAIASGALRGLGNTRATLIGNLVGHYGVGLPLSLALGSPSPRRW